MNEYIDEKLAAPLRKIGAAAFRSRHLDFSHGGGHRLRRQSRDSLAAR